MTTLTFWHVAGDVIWRGDGRCAPIHDQNIQGLLDIFDCEMRAASAANKTESACHFGELFVQLSKARDERNLWRFATSAPPVDPFQTAGRVVAHIVTGLNVTHASKGSKA